jgi:hypothetical protein
MQFLLWSVRARVSRVLANRSVGTGATAQWGIAGPSVELDKSSSTANPIIFWLSGSPPVTVRLVGSGSIPAQSGRTARRMVAAVITPFVINHPVTVIRKNTSRPKSAAVCSKVLDLLRPQSSLVALPASPEQCSADSAETVVATREGMSALSRISRPSTAQESAFLPSSSSEGLRLSDAASRQFLLALLEDCSFFAHLVLRCVRTAGCSPPRWAKQEFGKPGSNFRSSSVIPSEVQPTSRVLAQRTRQNPPALEAEPLSLTLPSLWVDVACRHMRTVAAQEKCHEYSEDPKHAL